MPPSIPSSPASPFRAELFAVGRDYVPLALMSLAACVLALGRRHFDSAPTYSFLPFNLFLAWIPVASSIALRLAHARFPRMSLVACLPLAALWLVFLPNAPYLVTDLVNLKWDNGAPRWYEVALLTSFGWAGLFLGLASLRDIHDLVARRTRPLAAWPFALAVIALSAFGIYLGRELRWNSWDVVTEPRALLDDLVTHLVNPFAFPRAWAMTAVFGTLLAVAYLAYRSVGGAARAGVTSSTR